MTPATAEEIHNVGKSFRLNLTEGYTLKNGLGVYRGKDGRGSPLVLAHFFPVMDWPEKSPVRVNIRRFTLIRELPMSPPHPTHASGHGAANTPLDVIID